MQHQQWTNNEVRAHLHSSAQLSSAALTSVFAVRQDIFGHLVAPAHVVLVGLGHSEFADWDQRSARWRQMQTIRKTVPPSYVYERTSCVSVEVFFRRALLQIEVIATQKSLYREVQN